MRILRSQHGLPQGVQWYGCDFWIPKKYVKLIGIDQESRAPIDRSVGSETFRPFRKSWQTDHTTDGHTGLQGSFASIREKHPWNHVLSLNKKEGYIWLKEWFKKWRSLRIRNICQEKASWRSDLWAFTVQSCSGIVLALVTFWQMQHIQRFVTISLLIKPFISSSSSKKLDIISNK